MLHRVENRWMDFFADHSQNPNVSKEDIANYIAKNRSAGREKLEKFLTPEQLKTWDAEVAKAKDFTSQ